LAREDDHEERARAGRAEGRPRPERGRARERAGRPRGRVRRPVRRAHAVTPGRDTPEGSRTVPRAPGATWALGVAAQTWATSMLTTDHDEPRLLAFLVACSAVTAVAGVVSARLSPVRWGEHAKPLAAAEAVTWLVLVLVGTALLVILPLLAPSDEQTVRLA